METDAPGILFVVATPIGNLGDLGVRAQETLERVDAILCEDTRVTSKLLARIGVAKPLVAYHQHSKEDRVDGIVSRLAAGESLAVVTDAGTPGISDPGGKLVKAVSDAFGPDARIVPIPGPSAITAALSVSGFPADRFAFHGFPPQKKGRAAFFDRLATDAGTAVAYESTHRIMKTLAEIRDRQPARRLVACRELTKLHETIYRGTAEEVTSALESTSIKGEFVLVLAPDG